MVGLIILLVLAVAIPQPTRSRFISRFFGRKAA